MPPSDIISDHGTSDSDDEREKEPEEDGPSDVMVLMVLDEMPRETLNQIFLDNENDRIWLADTYKNLPGSTNEALSDRGRRTLTADWRSPLLGQTVEDAVVWIRGIPKPGKLASRNFCAVLKKELFQESGSVLICKTPNEAVGRTQVETIPCSASLIGHFYHVFLRDAWALNYGDQMLY